MKKEMAIIGLGKMGGGIKKRLQKRGWKVLGFDKNPNLKKLAKGLNKPRVVWLMVPAGKPVEGLLFSKNGLVKFLEKGDIVIDGGNSFFEDSVKRAKKLAKQGIEFLDVGVSGGPGGEQVGYCLMIGGKKNVFDKLRPLFAALAAKRGFQYVGKSGAGHFVKMVHNGIEYGVMQAIAEGFNLMKKSPFDLDLKKVAALYNHGSVVESRLVGWLESAYKKHGQGLKKVSGSVAHTGEGEWTVKVAKKIRAPAKIIEESFKFRVRSAKNPGYAGKILSALRAEFGKHKIK